MPTVRRTYALIVVLLLTACGTTSQFVRVPDQSRVVEDQGKGRIYVIGRPFAVNIMSHNVTMRVTDEGELIGGIVGQGYLCWERPPGVATIASETASSPYGSAITLTIERGKVHYVLAHIGPKWSVGMFLTPGGGHLAVRLEVVTEAQGQTALAGTTPPEQK